MDEYKAQIDSLTTKFMDNISELARRTLLGSIVLPGNGLLPRKTVNKVMKRAAKKLATKMGKAVKKITKNAVKKVERKVAKKAAKAAKKSA